MITYLVLVIAVTNPAKCAPGKSRTLEQKIAMWGLLGFLAANVATSAVLIGMGFLGTPLTPSRRRFIPKVLYWDILKYLALVGFLAWALWYVVDGNKGCWTPSRKHDLEIVLWCTVSVVLLIFLIVFLGYDAMAAWVPDRRWNVRIKVMAWFMGCYKTLMNAELETFNEGEGGSGERYKYIDQGQLGEERQGRPQTAAEIIGGVFARLYGAIDLEKSDVVAGLTLASVMQAQRRRALSVAKFRRRKLALAPWAMDVLREGIFSCTLPENEECMCPFNRTAQILEEAEKTHNVVHGATTTTSHGTAVNGTTNQDADQLSDGSTFSRTDSILSRSREAAAANGGGASNFGNGEAPIAVSLPKENSTRINSRNGDDDVIINIPDEKSLSDWAINNPESPFRRWVRAVSDGSGVLLTPPRWIADAVAETENITPYDIFEIATGVMGKVDGDVLKEARHWLMYASAAYGTSTFVADEQRFHHKRYDALI